MSNFYIVQKDGVPAVWQVDPKGIARLLKRKSNVGYALASELPERSRSEALIRLRELFPGFRCAKPVSECPETA